MKDRASRAGGREDGFALLTVVATMTVLTLFLLAALALVLASAGPSRAAQDDKAALAAAQAGVDEYLSRLTANDNYWASDDCSNLALQPVGTCPTPRPATGVAVPGTSGAATYSYQLLTTPTSTAADGAIRLAVTGTSGGRSRRLIAEMSPSGFLQYIYFTDFEDLDPGLAISTTYRAQLNGVSEGPASGGSRVTWYYADPTVAAGLCSQHWSEGRSAPSYTTTAPVGTTGKYTSQVMTKDASTGAYTTFGSAVTQTMTATDTITFSCTEIQFGSGDKVNGPLKTNDALLLADSPLFTSPLTETAWATAPDPTRPWRGTGTPSAGTSGQPGYVPKIGSALTMPASNTDLQTAAAGSAGCVYSGATRITFTADGRMSVKSPATSGAVARCYSGTGGVETKDVPSVIYVKDTTATCSAGSLGYPLTGEALGLPATVDYDCHKGTAYVSGVLKGRVTVASANDIVVVGDTTYAGGPTGSDALGLIPQNYAWIYHPVDTSGANMLATPVTQLCAAVLSVSHSFLVQNYNYGAPISSGTTRTLQVRGAIAQRFRGAVSLFRSDGTLATGYSKDYVFDPRLANAPPPYFLKPVNSPYAVSKVSG